MRTFQVARIDELPKSDVVGAIQPIPYSPDLLTLFPAMGASPPPFKSGSAFALCPVKFTDGEESVQGCVVWIRGEGFSVIVDWETCQSLD